MNGVVVSRRHLSTTDLYDCYNSVKVLNLNNDYAINFLNLVLSKYYHCNPNPNPDQECIDLINTIRAEYYDQPISFRQLSN